MARAFIQGDVEQGANVVNTDGRASTTLVQRSYPSATVTVFNAGTAVLATIFSDEGGTPLANPFTADSSGHWGFWANQGRYDVKFSGAGIPSPYTLFSVDAVPSAATLADPGSNGYVVRTSLGVTVARSLTQPAAGITISNSDGVAGNSIFALANDLLAVEGLSTTGLAARTAADTWTIRSIVGTANRVVVTNGDGVAGNPTLDVGANVVTNAGAGTDNAIARFDLAGNVIQNSAVTIADTSGNMSVPNGWQVASTGGTSIALAAGAVTVTIPAGSLALLNSIVASSQSQSSGIVQVVKQATTYNQGGTAGSDDLALVRTETALGSGEHNFIRGLNGAAGTTVAFRIDRTGRLFQNQGISDLNGNELIIFSPTASAVNEITLANAATGGAPTVTLSGNDANVSARFVPKGTGRFAFGIPGASPVAGGITGPDSSGTNIAGANLELSGGAGTGNAIQGLSAFRYPLTAGSGSTLQSLSAASFPPWVSMHISSLAGDITVSNTTTETSVLAASQSGSTKTIEAGLGRIGRSFLVQLYGSVSTTATPTLRVRIKLGSVILADTTAITMANNTSSGGGGFVIEAIVDVTTIGAAGIVRCSALRAIYGVSNGGSTNQIVAAGSGVVDLTAAQTFDVTVQWGTASASNTVVIFLSVIEMSR